MALGQTALGQAASAADDASPPIRFVDRAADWGVEFRYESGQEGRFLPPEIFGGGVGLLDYDGDGDLDIYLAQGGRLTRDGVESVRDALFRQDVFVELGDGPGKRGRVRRRFVEVGSAAGLVPSGGYGMGVAVGDVDADGDPDVYVTAFGPDRLLRNRGDGTFEDATAATGLESTATAGWSVPAVFFDYDDDGRVDLWVGRYLDYRVADDTECSSVAGARDFCGPLVYGPLSDLLFHNEGEAFREVSRAAGLAREAGQGRALGGVSFDADGDGLLDLYVANDMGENFLWRNVGDGTFVDEALLAGAALNRRGEAEGSMGVEAQDVDGDGDDDLFMTHTTLESNTLFVNQGGWLFDDRSRESGLGAPSLGRTGFGTVMFDADLDGDLDTFVANGAVRAVEALARQGDAFPYHEPDQVFANEGGTFRAVPAAGVERSDTARAAARGDLDGDGDPDLVVCHLDANLEVFDNVSTSTDAPKTAAWLGVRVLGTTGGDFVGSRVDLRRDGRTVRRRVHTDGGYGAAHDPRVVFGLGDDPAADSDLTLDVHAVGRSVRWRGLETGVYVVVPMADER